MAFISYDSYKNRIEKLAKFKNFVSKYKFLIIGVLAVILGGASALMATKGMVTTDITLSASTYTYGESYAPTTASAFLSDVGYEYTVQGTDEWTDKKPVKVGKYSVRAVTKKIIGKGYGNPVNFEILPAEITFAFTNSTATTLTYGSDPAARDYNYTGLISAYGDKVQGVDFDYVYPEADDTDFNVGVTLKKLEITGGGEDRSNCYVYEKPSTVYKFGKKTVTFQIADEAETYNGKGFSFKGKPNPATLRQLVGSDNFEIDTTLNGGVSPVNAGSYVIALNGVQVFDENGKNVTYRYITEPVNGTFNGTFTINRRPVTFLSESKEWVYDGDVHSHNKYTTTEGTVVEGHTVTATSVTTVTNVWDGKQANVLTYAIDDGSGNPVTTNYEVTAKTGTLVILKRGVTVTLNDIASVIYGNAVNYIGGGEKIENAIGVCAVGVDANKLQYNPSGNYSYPNAGSYKVLCDGSDITITSGGNDVTGNYSVTTVNGGSLTISAREIILTLQDYPLCYGDPLTPPTPAIGGDGLASGESFNGAYLYDGNKAILLNTGTYTVTVDKDNCGYTRYGAPVPATNYIIINTPQSTLTVDARKVTVTLNATTATYGNAVSYISGNESTHNVVAGQTVLVDAFKVTFGAFSTMPDAGTYVGAVTCDKEAVTILSGATPVTSNYAITVCAGTLYINQRAITVKAKDMLGIIYGEKIEYDIKEGNYANTPDLATGEKLTVENVLFDYKQGTVNPAVGEYDITPDQITILKADEVTPSRANYVITPEDGTLEIVKRPIRIESDTSDDLIYDGTPQYNKSYEVKLDDKNYYDILSVHEIVVTEWTTVIDVTAAVQNRHSYDIVDQSGTTVKGNYEIYTGSGYLIVNRRPITVKLSSYSATYGEAYTYPTGEGNYDQTALPDLATDETLEITTVTFDFTGTRPAVGKYAITKPASCKILKANGKDGSDGNYTVEFENGELEITPRDITVSLLSYSAEYGESYAYPTTAAGNYDKTVLPDLVADDTLRITAVEYGFGSVQHPEVNADGYSITQTGYEIISNGEDGNGNYNVEWIDGTLTITKRTITVTLNDVPSVAYGETVTYIKGGEKVENAIGVCTVDVDTANLDFNPAKANATYDYPDAGAYIVGCDSADITVLNGTNDVTHNYTVTVNSGNLEITKRNITVRPSDYERVYGEDFGYTGVTPNNKITEGSLAKFDGVEETLKIFVAAFEFDGPTVWNVGEYPFKPLPDGYTVIKVDGTTDSTENYEVKFEEATLTITKKQIEVELVKNKIFTYGEDGVKDAQGKTKTYAELYAELIEEVEITSTQKLKLEFSFTDDKGNPADPHDAGEYGIKIANGETENFEITPKEEVTLTISPRQLHPIPYVITAVYGATEFNYPSIAEGASTNFDELYNQQLHCRPAYSDKIEIFVSYNLDGQTVPSVGKYAAELTGVTVYYSNNTPEHAEFKLSAGGNYFETKNYTIFIAEDEFKEKLEITPRGITVKLYDNEVFYGDTHDYVTLKGGVYEDITDGELVTYNGNTQILTITAVEYEFGSKQYPDAREEAYAVSKAEYQITTADDEIISPDNYDITFEGTLLIKKRKITISLIEDQEFTYFVEEVDPKFQAFGFPQDLVDAEKVKSFISYWQYSVDGEEWFDCDGVVLNEIYLDVGTYYVKGTVGVVSYDGRVQWDPLSKNHDVDYKVGTIKVTPLELRLETKDGVFEYDGTEHEETGFKVFRIDTGDEVEFTQSIIDLVQVVSSTKITNVAESGKENVVKYDFSQTNYTVADDVSYGTLTVTPREITVQSATNLDGLIYNGEEQYDEGFTVTVGTLVDGHEIRVDTHTGITDVAEAVDNELTYIIVDTKDNDKIVTGNYEITDDYGSIKINPLPITVTLNDVDAVYTGKENIDYKNGGFTAVGVLETLGHSLQLDPDGISIQPIDGAIFPNAGEYSITCDKTYIKIFDGGEEVTGNYKITVTGGTLTVNALEITLTLKDYNKAVVYGETIPFPEITGTVNGDTVTGGLIYKNTETEAEYNSANIGENKYLPVGQYLVYLDLNNYTVAYADGNIFTCTDDKAEGIQNYLIAEDGVIPASLTISKRKITITLKDIEREYGELNCSWIFWHKGISADYQLIAGELGEFMAITGELAPGEEITAFDLVGYGSSANAVFKNAGTYKLSVGSIGLSNKWEDTIYDNELGNIGNYEVTVVEPATLTINPKEVTLNIGDIEVTYGDKDNALDGYTYTTTEKDGIPFKETLVLPALNLEGWRDYPYGLDADYRLNVGTYDLAHDYNTKYFESYDAQGEEIDGYDNYNVTVSGRLVVKKRPISVSLLTFDDEYFYGDAKLLVYPEEAGNYKSLGYLQANGADEGKEGLAYGQQLQIKIQWFYNNAGVDAPKNAGTYKYLININKSVVYDEDGNEIPDGASNYQYFADPCYVEIKPVQLKLDLAERECIYGDELPFEPYGFIELPDLNSTMKYEGEVLEINIVYYDWNEYAYGREVEVVPKDVDSYIYSTTDYRVYDADGTLQTAQNYVLAKVWEGALYIKPREITVYATDIPDVVYGDPVIYTAQQGNHGAIDGKGLAEGQYLTITSVVYYDKDNNLVEGAPTEVGTYYIVPAGVEICDEDGNTIDINNYNPYYPATFDDLTNYGKVKILPQEIRLETATRTDFIYNGEEQYDTSYTLWLLDAQGNKREILELTEEEAKLVKVLDGYATITDVSESGKQNRVYYDFSETNYTISDEVDYGTLTVQPRPITVVRDSAVKEEYDGKALTCTEYVDTYYEDEDGNILFGLLPGDTVHAVAGTITKLYRATTIDNQTQFEADSENYKVIGAEGGTLTVMPRKISISLISNYGLIYGDKTYSDDFDNFTLENGSTLAEGDSLKVAVKYVLKDGSEETSVKNVGTYTVLFDNAHSEVETSYDNANGISNYDVEVIGEAEIKISARDITVTLKELDNKIYGENFVGYPKGAGNYAGLSGQLVYDDALEVFVKYFKGETEVPIGIRTNAGYYDVKLSSYAVYDQDGEDITAFGNYNIISAGNKTLTVDPRPITVVTGSLSEEYDGEEHSAPNFTKTYYFGEKSKAGLLSGDENVLEISQAANSVINVTSIPNEVEFRSTSQNYTVEEHYRGTLEIYKRKITVVLDGVADTVYGKTLTYPDSYGNFTYAQGSKLLVDGETLKIAVAFYYYGENGKAVYGAPKNAGNYYYDIDSTNSTVANSKGGLPDGVGNYDIKTAEVGEAKIDKLEITIKMVAPWSASGLIYDGAKRALGIGNYEIVSGGVDGERKFVDGETLHLAVLYYQGDILLTGAPVNAGTYKVVFDRTKSTINGTVKISKNYVIYDEGDISFTITPKDITITMYDEERPYDGKSYDYLTEYTAENFVSQAADGERIIPSAVTYDDDIRKIVGTYQITLTDFDVEGGLKSNYNLLEESSKLNCEVVIKRRDITFTTEPLSLEAREPINPELSVGGLGFVDGEELTPEYTYYVVGEDDVLTEIAKEEIVTRGNYEIEVSFNDENNVLANYNPTYTNGTLEITARQVTVNTTYSGDGFTYSGEPISLDGFGYTHYHTPKPTEDGFFEDNVPTREFVFIDASGKEYSDSAPVDAGVYTVTVRFPDASVNDYFITVKDEVKITILPKDVNISLDGYQEDMLDSYLTYSFDELPKAESLFNVTVDGIVSGETSTVELYYYLTNFNDYGMDDGEVVYNYAGDYRIEARIVKDGEVDKNYKIADLTKITFTVEKATLYVTPVGQKVDYTEEGQTLSLTGYEIREEYGTLQENGAVKDTLTVEGSSVLMVTRSIPVTIKSVTIKQGDLTVTDCYDVHCRYDENDRLAGEAEWYTKSAFTATLAFNPVVITYEQTPVLNGEDVEDTVLRLPFTGKPYDLADYGVDKDNLAQYINITSGSFVGDCTLKYNLMPVGTGYAREYEKWIQILVFDSNNRNVTGLYDFRLTNANDSKIVVYGDYLDFDLKEDYDLSNAEESTLYKGYYVLSDSEYTLDGLTDDNHEYEVLVKDGALRVIIYTKGANGRIEASTNYSLRVPEELGVSVKLTQIAQIIASSTIN